MPNGTMYHRQQLIRMQRQQRLQDLMRQREERKKVSADLQKRKEEKARARLQVKKYVAKDEIKKVPAVAARGAPARMPARKTIEQKKFNHVSNHHRKYEARRVAETRRRVGYNARVVPDQSRRKTRWSVYDKKKEY